MKIQQHTDGNVLYIEIEGRIDASNAAEAEGEITAIKEAYADKHTVIDADRLEYISSAGLRIILKLRKLDADLAIINVSPEVYDILDMTGFTDMVRVEKAFRRLSVEGCEFIARGANGAVYRYDDETIVKVYFSKDSLPEIQRERENARKAFVLGINTAIPYGVVRVGNGYGMVTELLNAKSITELIRTSPEDLDPAIGHYVDMLKCIHATEANPDTFPDMKTTVLSWVAYVVGHLPQEYASKLERLVNAVPACNTVLHGDYNTNNVMVQNNETMLIDMDTLGLGHPIFELASMYNAFLGFSEIEYDDVERFFGYDRPTSQRFWDMTLKRYLGTDDAAVIESVQAKAKAIGYVRILRRVLRRPNDPGAKEKTEYYTRQLMRALDAVDTLVF